MMNWAYEVSHYLGKLSKRFVTISRPWTRGSQPM